MSALPRPLMGLALAVLPAQAPAGETLCSFETECFEAEECAETDFELTVTEGDAPGRVVLGSISDNVTGHLRVDDDGATLIVAEGPSSLQILTVVPDGAARYSLHLTSGPAVLSYLGSCEAAR